MQFLLHSAYELEPRVQRVIVKHKKKFYIGEARLHPDDECSKLFGYRLAENRAILKGLKDTYKQKKADCEACRKFVRAVEGYAKFNPEDPSAKAMYRQLNRRIKEVNDLADTINSLLMQIKTMPGIRENALKKIELKRQKSLIENE